MKNRVFATLSSLTLLTAAAAFGQSHLMRADIPFEFRVGTKILPAGHYDVGRAAPGVLSIRCFERNAAVMILTEVIEAREVPEKGTLVFKRYDNTYFLSRVWTPGSSSGQELHKSKAERELARANSAIPTTVALASR